MLSKIGNHTEYELKIKLSKKLFSLVKAKAEQVNIGLHTLPPTTTNCLTISWHIRGLGLSISP